MPSPFRTAPGVLPCALALALAGSACASSPSAPRATPAPAVALRPMPEVPPQATAPAPPVAAASPVTPSSDRLTAAGLARDARDANWTVVVFIGRECPCLAAHDPRLRELAAMFQPRGVKFVGVDSEVGTSPEIAAAEAKKRQYPFPVVADTGAHLADELGAEFATYTVILNRAGEVLYRGGIDSDKQKLHATATPYVREVLTDLTAGKAPRRTEGKALGCVLRKW